VKAGVKDEAVTMYKPALQVHLSDAVSSVEDLA
jgi:hypothetical protein